MLRCSGGCFRNLSGHPGSIQVHPKSIDLSRCYPKEGKNGSWSLHCKYVLAVRQQQNQKPSIKCTHPKTNKLRKMWLFSTNQTSKTINVFHKTNKIAPTFRTAQCNLGVSHIFQPQPLNFFKMTNHPQLDPWLSKLHLPGLTVQVLRVPRPSPNPFLSSLESTIFFGFFEDDFSTNKKLGSYFSTKKKWHDMFLLYIF